MTLRLLENLAIASKAICKQLHSLPPGMKVYDSVECTVTLHFDVPSRVKNKHLQFRVLLTVSWLRLRIRLYRLKARVPANLVGLPQESRKEIQRGAYKQRRDRERERERERG